MILLAAADERSFADLADDCGPTRWCSRSCEELGAHVLIVPETPYETYDDIVRRARVELPAVVGRERGEGHGQ